MWFTVTSWYYDVKVSCIASLNLNGKEEGEKSPLNTNNNKIPG